MWGPVMMRIFNERCVREDFHFSLNVNVNVTVVSYMNNRSSHHRRSFEKGVLKNSAKFTENHPRQSPFFNKVSVY